MAQLKKSQNELMENNRICGETCLPMPTGMAPDDDDDTDDTNLSSRTAQDI